MQSFSALCAVLTLSIVPVCNAGSPPTPPAPPAPPAGYVGLYNKLNGDLGAFNTTLSTLWSGTTSPVLFGGNLSSANGNEGPNLLTYGNPVLQIQAMKAVGAQAVVVQVGFPALYPPFYDYLATQPGYQNMTYAQFANLYQQIGQSVHAAGLKLVVEADNLLSNDVQAGWGSVVGPYYLTLDWPTFQTARAQHTLNIATLMQPDYLVVMQEPTSEAAQTGQSNLNTVSGAASLVNQVLTTLAPVRGSMKVGAGTCNDQQGYQGFIQSFAGVNCSSSQPCVNPPGVDFIDLHVYPVNNMPNQNFLQNALGIISIAQSAGKPVSMTEAWMWKIRDGEWNTLPFDTMRARDPFSFWAPLDAYFLQTMVNLANYAQMLFMVPEGPYYLFAYQDYNSTTKAMSPTQILNQETTLASQANQTAAYSYTGMNYYNMLVTTPNTTPPTTPTLLSAAAGSATTASLSWSPSTDNVGVAGYYLWRNGTQLPTTAMTTFQDSGLTPNTTYTYEVEAFDLAGNVSATLTATVTTQTDSGPNPPQNLTAAASQPQQVTLTWQAPSGSVPVSAYLLFRGANPNQLVQVQTLPVTDTSFNNANLTPGTTYYYGLEAKYQGLISPMSNIAMVTTPAVNPPQNLAATASQPQQVTLSWQPPSGSLPVTSYLLFRGTDPGQLVQVQTVPATDTSFNNNNLTPGTTYYFGMETKYQGLVSPMSNIATVTTPSANSPQNLAATAPEPQQVTLSWQAPSGGVPVSGYLLFRGTSPNQLVQVQTLPATDTSFNNANLTPGTTYYYGMEATYKGTTSPMSNIATVTTPAVNPPQNLAATAPHPQEVTLTWQAPSGGAPITDYLLFRGTDPNQLVQVQTVPATATSFNQGNLTSGTTYYYGLQANYQGLASPMSNVVSVTMP